MTVKLLWEPEGLDEPLENWLSSQTAKAEQVLALLFDHQWPEWRSCGQIQISLAFLDEVTMAEVNGQYRDEPRPTDVLSFPFWEDEEGNFVPPQQAEELPLGDLLFCSSVLRRNALEAGQPPEAELALLLIHGTLHLLAWDHDTKERETAMWQIQQTYQKLLIEGDEKALKAFSQEG